MDRVVIIDNDTPDPTFEERRRRHQRRERLRRVKWFKLAGVVVAIIVFVAGVLASPLFAIRRVTFEGVVYTSPETVEKVTEAIKGASVFTVDTAKAREQLLDDPWVAEVRITTDFPGKALVEVAERTPVVWYVGDDEKARVVDDRGHVVAVLDGWPTKYLRVIGTGPSLDAGTIADDVYRAAAQLVLALPGEIRSKVKALELSGGGELAMILKTGTIVRFGPPTGLQDKLIAVVVLFRRQDPATLAVVDVSTGEPTVQLR
jgi:cell division septal protein FtsQ